jgi:cation/acetate symporter
VDKNGDGRIQYTGDGPAFETLGDDPKFKVHFTAGPDGSPTRGEFGERILDNPPTANANELYIDRDIMVLANPEIGGLPSWVVGLIAAGGLAAALSTAAGLLLVISTAVAHDLVKKTFVPGMSEKAELIWARCAAAVAVVVAGYFGIKPPGFVAEVVAFAFGLAASSFFPAIILGIFTKRTTTAGVICGMLAGISFTMAYIIYFKFGIPFTDIVGTADQHWFGITPEGIGTIGMVLNFVVTITVSSFTPKPAKEIRDLVDRVRLPRAAFGEEDTSPHDH